MNERVILITEADLGGLREAILEERAVSGSGQQLAEPQDWLERAEVVEASAIPGDLIAMHSAFALADLETGRTET